MSSAPSTLAQKLVARASGRTGLAPGDIVNCRVDLAMFHDSSGPRRLKPMLDELGATIWDKSRVVLVMDHYLPERDEESRRIVRIARDWAREQALPHVYDGQGICHVVVPQHGHIRPGMFCVGAIRIRPRVGPSVPTCSASAAPRCWAWWSPARSGCACRTRCRCIGVESSPLA